jgi:outer membrane protein OmpA-like peptidoglycan-associated protein
MTWSRRIFCLLSIAGLATGLAACSGGKTDQSAAASPAASTVASAESTPPAAASSSPAAESSPGAAVTSAPEAAGSPEASAAATGAAASPAAATPAPTASPDPNLLASENGTIVRSYPPGTGNDPREYADSGISVTDATKPPYAIVFELPGVATIASFGAKFLDPPAGQTPGITFAVSTTSATDGFHDVGKLTDSPTASAPPTLNANVSARWVRVTLDNGAKNLVERISALGTLAPRPAAAPALTGVFVEGKPYDKRDGTFQPDPGPSTDPWYVRFVGASGGGSGPDGLTAQRCYDGRLGDAYAGAIDGRTWSWRSGATSGRLTANDEGSLVANHDTYYTRTDRLPKWCQPQDGGGTGATRVLLLESTDTALYPVGDRASDAHGFHFDVEGAGLFDPAQLSRYSTVMMNGVCDATQYLSPPAGRALTDWVAAGHKLMIYDADMCGKQTNYSFLPYPFSSNNPGANGAKGDRLIEVENDQLGSLDASDKAHFFDPAPFAANSNQLGDANTVTSHDSHWCGHLFGTNVNHVNGFMQMYAPYGKGLIVYDGLDHDDGANQYYQRIRLLELAAAVDGNNPCTQNVSLSFLIEPNRETTFIPGKSVTKTFSMELLANQGWKGHVALTTSGDFTGVVTPSVLDVNGGTTPLKIAVSIPASAKPGQYALIVNGNGGGTASAQATISLSAAVPIVKQLKIQRRIRLYGIHFDVDSARIQPRSEPVIAEVAAIMRDNPQWRFRIEGHTDSDGGVAHNQVLSLHRAQSVIDDLVTRYHIARSRLVAAGFGLSRPVASNATAAGKALNRRVELVRL